MRALAKETEASTVRLADAAQPEPQPGEVLVRVRAAAICGTNLQCHAADSLGSARREASGSSLLNAIMGDPAVTTL